jgi:excisionase family DNA binding protein
VAEYLKLPEVARRLDVSEKTARRYVKSGELPSVFIGGAYRVSEEDLEKFLSGAKVVPGGGYPKDSASPSFNNVIDERRLSRFADAITATADEWIQTASEPDVAERKLWGIVDAALDLYSAISTPVEDDEEAWERLTNPERREMVAVLEKLNEVARCVLDRLDESAEARDQEEKARHNREKIREWTRKIA